MSYEQRAAEMGREEIAALLARNDELTARNGELTTQLEWFKRQLFGPKSERRLVSEPGSQLWLGELTAVDAADLLDQTEPELLDASSPGGEVEVERGHLVGKRAVIGVQELQNPRRARRAS